MQGLYKRIQLCFLWRCPGVVPTCRSPSTVAMSPQGFQDPPCLALCWSFCIFADRLWAAIKTAPCEVSSAESKVSLLGGTFQPQLSQPPWLVLVVFLCRVSVSSQRVVCSETVCRLITARQETASLCLRSAVITMDVAREMSKANLSPLLLKTRSDVL